MRHGFAGRIAVVLGTRPEIIKMAEVVRLLGDRAFVVHSGQHWDEMMSGHFMEHLALPQPELSLNVGGSTRAAQIAGTLTGIDEAFASDRPDAIVVQGDTNTVVGGALVANSIDIPLVHVEAGLRSFDRAMPEEHNRVIADHLADLCLAPTDQARQNLISENIPAERIVVTGNTVVGAVERALAEGRDAAAQLLHQHQLGADDDYIVATIHRPENTDEPERLGQILRSLQELSQACPVLMPLHPRTRQRAESYGLSELLDDLTTLGPLGYDEFVSLSAGAALVISDSGGVQEEASVWKRPVIVVRRSTERPEVIGSFATLCDDPWRLTELGERILEDGLQIRQGLATVPSPYGDGSAAAQCVRAIEALLG